MIIDQKEYVEHVGKERIKSHSDVPVSKLEKLDERIAKGKSNITNLLQKK